MKRRVQWAALAVLLVVLGFVWFGGGRNSGIAAVFTGSTRIDRFVVPNPNLRLDLLKEISKQEYSGMQRNIFKSAPLPQQFECVSPQALDFSSTASNKSRSG